MGATVAPGTGKNSMRVPARWVCASAAGLLTATLGAASAANAAPSSRATLPGSVPSWATASAFKGAADPSDHVGFRVYLGWRGGDAAAAYASAVSTPSSPDYGHYLTPQQFRAKYAPARADVQAVQQWLRRQGFHLDYTPLNGHYVAAEGTVAQASDAFGAAFGEYRVDGKTLRSPKQPLTIPSSLQKAVEGVVGLDQSAALVHTDHVVSDAPPSAGFRNATPCSAYWAEKVDKEQPGDYPYAPCGYTPSQLEGAYGVADAINSGNDGSGVTVGIIDAYASPTIEQDANEYFTKHPGNSIPQLNGSNFRQVVAPGTYRMPDSPAQGASGWYGEETLDVEATHTMAPGADIVYVGAPNNYQDLDAALNHVVDQHLADIVTNSYGWSTEQLPRGYYQPYEDIIVQGAAEGIGIYFSSGDYGDETGGTGDPTTATPDWPAVSPFVTAVGGTSLAVDQNNNYLFETGWETEKKALTGDNTWGTAKYVYGSGGGTSRIWAQPGYQAGVVPDDMATAGGERSQPMRVVPDISMLGDPNTGMLVGQTQTFSDGAYYDEYRIGGTSLASPLMAGVMALAQQRAGGHPLGFANPLLYEASKTSGTLHDVPASGDVTANGPLDVVRVDYSNYEGGSTVRSLRLLGDDQNLTIHAGPGYDDVTGLGTPNGNKFLDTLKK